MVTFFPALVPLLVSVGDVQPWPDNPNNGDVDLIAESMRVNGVFTPIVAQRSTRYILVGNHRYAALLMLGESQVPVVWVDVDDEKAQRIAVVDNGASKASTMDLGLLTPILDDLSDTELGLLGTGYSEQFLANLHLDNEIALDLDEPAVKQRKTFQCPNCGWQA